MLPGPERDWIHLVWWARSVENAPGNFLDDGTVSRNLKKKADNKPNKDLGNLF